LERGDIFDVDLEPTKGREQRGRRPVIVVTTAEFNRHNAPIVCPITGGGESARLKGFAVPLSGAGTKTDGVVLCNQPRVLDISARRGKRIERAPDSVVDEVLAALQDIFE
jgi:mRNA interferase ChpB